MARTIDLENLRQRLIPLATGIVAETSAEELAGRLVDFGIECYHAGRKAERQYWAERFEEQAAECRATPVFDEGEKIVPD